VTDEHTQAPVSTTWMRPEFKGQWDKLINLADVAQRAGVTRPAVSNWRARYPDFPAAVVEQRDDRRTPSRVWISTDEFDAWHKTHSQSTGKRSGQTAKGRKATVRRLTQQLSAVDRRLEAARATVTDLESERAQIQEALEQALTDTEADVAAARTVLGR
jgi:hypothetical protein